MATEQPGTDIDTLDIDDRRRIQQLVVEAASHIAKNEPDLALVALKEIERIVNTASGD